jgi:hypothetical protein
MFLGHKHMFLQFLSRNICLFLVAIDLQGTRLTITKELGLDSKPRLSSDFRQLTDDLVKNREGAQDPSQHNVR